MTDDLYSQRMKVADRIAQKLHKRLQKGNYENFGMKELRQFQGENMSLDLTYQEKCSLYSHLSFSIDHMQRGK